MLIVNCLGGLGNQMFQYAYYLELASRYPDVYFDISNFANYDLHHGYELERVFAVSPNIINAQETLMFKKSFFNRLLRKLKIHDFILSQQDFAYNSKYINLKGNYILDGYWQSEKYFSNCVNQVQRDFKFPKLDDKNNLLARQIAIVNSVSIHVRRGDYVNHPLHGGICNLDYYQQGIELIKAGIKDPCFYIFSNDIAWCRNNLALPNAIYVTDNYAQNSYKDMHLMSLCKHNIIANSSFSWWGAWLNNNPNKLVIAPSKWFNDTQINVIDLLPQQWIKL